MEKIVLSVLPSWKVSDLPFKPWPSVCTLAPLFNYLFSYDGTTKGPQADWVVLLAIIIIIHMYIFVFLIYKLKVLVGRGRWKQLSSFRSPSFKGGSAILRRVDAFAAFPKCCSQWFKTFNNICTGSFRIVSANFLCPTAMRDSQKPLKFRDARPDSLPGWRRLMFMNMMSNAAREKPKSVRWHRLKQEKLCWWISLRSDTG